MVRALKKHRMLLGISPELFFLFRKPMFLKTGSQCQERLENLLLVYWSASQASQTKRAKRGEWSRQLQLLSASWSRRCRFTGSGESRNQNPGRGSRKDSHRDSPNHKTWSGCPAFFPDMAWVDRHFASVDCGRNGSFMPEGRI